jgi:hypothetical protein
MDNLRNSKLWIISNEKNYKIKEYPINEYPIEK